ncbi:hypothetical protein T484DRAFT_1981241 [Baffinella frigidus]|nr:hypothetical protein T484DRAFT_1981241 [Cryptophyta sp. CCMP2293]
MSPGRMRRGTMMECKTLAPKFGVTEKTIREIWRGLTHQEATRPMWTQEEISARLRGSHGDDEDDDTLTSPIDPPAAHEPSNTSTVSQAKSSLSDATGVWGLGGGPVGIGGAEFSHVGASANLPYPCFGILPYPSASTAPINAPLAPMLLNNALHSQSCHLPSRLQTNPLVSAQPNTYGFASPQPNHRIASSPPVLHAFASAHPHQHGVALPPGFLASYITSSGAAFQNAQNAFSSGFPSPNL